MTAVATWLARGPRTRLRLLEMVCEDPGTIVDIARRVTSKRHVWFYCRHLDELRDRGLIYERVDGVLVITAPGRNALSKARRLRRVVKRG